MVLVFYFCFRFTMKHKILQERYRIGRIIINDNWLLVRGTTTIIGSICHAFCFTSLSLGFRPMGKVRLLQIRKIFSQKCAHFRAYYQRELRASEACSCCCFALSPFLSLQEPYATDSFSLNCTGNCKSHLYCHHQWDILSSSETNSH